ncbi:MAG: hypothetical protein ACRCYZ_01365 [Alphaproteobacteria bacterium]
MDLPNEMLEKVIKHAGFEALQSVKLANHRFNDIASNLVFRRQYTEGEAFSWGELTKPAFVKLSLGRSQLQAFLEGAENETFAPVAPKILELGINLSKLEDLKCRPILELREEFRQQGNPLSSIPVRLITEKGVSHISGFLKKLENLKTLSVSLSGDGGIYQSDVWGPLAKEFKEGGMPNLKRLNIHHPPAGELIDARGYHQINSIANLKALNALKNLPGIAVELFEIPSHN